jgi:hypothetical protein
MMLPAASQAHEKSGVNEGAEFPVIRKKTGGLSRPFRPVRGRIISYFASMMV